MRPWCRMTAPYTSELAEALADDVLDRLLRYVRIDTQSDPAHTQSPSTPGQLDLARLLVEELQGIGLDDAAIDANGFVLVALPKRGTLLDPERMPELTAKVGHHIVTTSGDTLLGADDKAGVAEVMAAV